MEKIGRFEIMEVLGRGGIGVVYKARDPLVERDVAIKVILERALDTPEIKERFYREARSAGKLSHQNITVVYEVGEVNSNPYVVMEYLEGLELRKIIQEKRAVPPQDKINYAIQICQGLQYAHSHKIIHLNITPDNIKIIKNSKIKIMDFGIAKPETMNLMAVRGSHYMTPEECKGRKVDNRSDIFSFGVLFYELLTYKKPFFSSSGSFPIMYKIVHEEPEKIVLEENELVDDLQKILTKCLQKEPDARYGDCSEVLGDLVRLLRKN